MFKAVPGPVLASCRRFAAARWRWRWLTRALVATAALPACYLAHGPDGEDGPRESTPRAYAQLVRGSDHACVLLGDASVRCWGANAFGQLGVGAPADSGHERRSPERVAGLPPVRQISAGGALTCALDFQGRVHCWGANSHGQLGIGLNAAPDRCAAFDHEPTDCAARPVEIDGLDEIVQVSAAGLHACALRADQRVLCWGFIALDLRDSAQAPPPAIGGAALETSDYSIAGTPVAMRGVAAARQIAAGASIFGPGHTCATLADGGVQCWGNRTFGQTGPADAGLDARDPLPAEHGRFALDADAVHVAAGGAHSCAVTAGGELFCWGLLPSGTVRTPVRMAGIEDAVAVSIHDDGEGDPQTCALRSDSTVTCWYGDQHAQVPGLSDVVELSGNCATVRDGGVYCWQPLAEPTPVAEVALASGTGA